MEFVGIEKQLFEELVRKFEYFEHRVMEICNRENDRTLHKWMDNQDVPFGYKIKTKHQQYTSMGIICLYLLEVCNTRIHFLCE